jgi:hypothetical protein
MEVIYAYTRAQAIADGVLVDVSDMGKEAGFIYPVAMTDTVFDRYVRVPEGVAWQDEKGRLWDIIWMLKVTIGMHLGEDKNPLMFSLYVQNDESGPELVQLKAVCGPGDNLEPVVTIMMPDEDWPTGSAASAASLSERRYMKRVFRLLLIHIIFRDRCPLCFGVGRTGSGWSTVPNCPDCKGAGFLCWECGKPMKVVCGKNFLSYFCQHCPERDGVAIKA